MGLLERRRTMMNDELSDSSGPIITLDKCKGSYFNDFNLYGKSVQTTTTGAQLFDVTKGIKNHVTSEINGNVIKIAGQTQYASLTTELQIEKVAGKKIVLQGKISQNAISNSRASIRIVLTREDAQQPAEYFLLSDNQQAIVVDVPTDISRIQLQLLANNISGGTEQPNTVWFEDVMVRLGDTADVLPWERYTGGQPSPNPAYPQEIINAGRRTEQLCNLPDVEPVETNGITWSCKGGVVTVSGTCTSANNSSQLAGIMYNVPLKAGSYYITGKVGAINSYVIVTKNNGTVNYYNNMRFVLDGTELSAIMCLQVNGEGVTVDNIKVTPMLNAGDIALPWEPYGYRIDLNISDGGNQQQTVPIYLPEPLRSIGDVRDRIVRKTGVWYVERNTRQSTFTGKNEEIWSKEIRDGVKRYLINVKGNLPESRKNIVSNRFYSCTTGHITGSGFAWADLLYLYADFESVADFKRWLADNPTTVIHPLPAPVLTPVDSDTSIALHTLHAYAGITSISNSESANMNVKYRKLR